MTMHRARPFLLSAALLIPATASAQSAAQPAAASDAPFDSAFFAWEAGNYPAALAQLQRILGGADAARYLVPAAMLTGEVFRTAELTTDGRATRWSPDGRMVLWETGAGADRRVHAIAAAGGDPVSTDGHSATADAAGILFLRVPESGPLRAARAAVDSAVAARDNQAAFQARGRLAQLEAAATRAYRRDARGRETALNTGDIVVQALSVRTADGSIYVLGAPAEAGNTTHVYRIGNGAPQRITTADGPKVDPVWLGTTHLLYSIDRQSFAVQDLSSGAVTVHRGTQHAVSADGSAVAFVVQQGDTSIVRVLRVGGGVADAVRRTQPVASPALSPDGRRIVYQSMPREDWELYVVDADGTNETRLTREIQHDILPRFVDDSTVFAVMGEARHRRSYLYDVRTGERTRLFHNNTVRTVSPEYDWVLSPERTRVLILAERDGDTVSPERGVYMMDLGARVTLPELRERVARQLAGEQALRTRGAQLFAGIEPAVRAAVGDVSKDRIYEYELDLYRFDSKFITQPGNAKAIEYITGRLREWGYEPEVQWFEARGVRTANVIAPLRGTVQPDVLYTVSSHFDSVERGPGADDDTSGTAALLEAARVLATRPQPATIHFAFFTGEEAGLLGSREYVRRAVERGDHLVGALNNDMVGFANDQRLDNTIRYSNPGIRDIQHAAAFLFTNLITYDAKYYKNTDAHAYYDAYGDIVGGIGSYPILGNPHYHQTHDQLETINHQLVAEVSKTTVATLVHLTNSPSRVKNVRVERAGDRLNVTWDALPESDVTGYVVEVATASAPAAAAARVPAGAAQPRATVTLPAGATEVRVSAVNRRGAHSWDYARAVIPAR